MNDDNRGISGNAFLLQAFLYIHLLVFSWNELFWIGLRREWLWQWHISASFQCCAYQPQIRDGGVFRHEKRKRIGEKWRTRRDGIAHATRNCRQIEERCSPPEIGTQVDGDIVVAPAQLFRYTKEQLIGR